MNSIFEIIDKSLQYLTDRERPNFNSPISYPLIAKRQKFALTTGYISTLHIHRFYNCAMFLDETQCDSQILKDLSQHTAISDVFQAYEALVRLCAHDPKDMSQKDLFILGYRAGLHVAGKYDNALFLKGQELTSCIISDLLLLQKKHEDASRAQARIIMKHYGIPKEQFRAMAFDQASIDDEGKPVDGQPIRSMLIEEDHIDNNGEPIPTEHIENGRIIPDTVPDYSERFMGGEADAPVERILYVAPDIAAAAAEDMQARGLEVSPEIAAAAEEARKQNLNDNQPIPNEGDVIHGGGSPTHIDTITDPA